MKVCNYLELESAFATSGIGTAVENQRKALKKVGIESIDNPRENYDIFHTNTIGPGSLYYIKKCNFNEKKVVIHAHTTSEDFQDSFKFSNQLSKPLKKYLEFYYDQGDILLCPSEYTKNRLKEYNIQKDPIVVSNGIDTQQFTPNPTLRKEYRKKLKLKGVSVFAVGSVFKRKGVDTFAKIAKKFPQTDFIWFGPQYRGLQKKETKKTIKNSPKNVTFTGKINNILGAYSAGDIFLFPSRNENQGIAILEAASCGKPILIRDIPAFNYLKHEKNCLKAKKEEEFKKHLDILLNNENLRNKLSKNARMSAEQHSLKKIGNRLKKIYKEIA
ncbi:glycosyl transferase family 1 [archaeon SCG-AAA382B04]|nr:glycosyl transferase family 1 [archaeon SCG-AAA382B04]